LPPLNFPSGYATEYNTHLQKLQALNTHFGESSAATSTPK